MKLTEKQKNCPYCHTGRNIIHNELLTMRITEYCMNGNTCVQFGQTDMDHAYQDDDGSREVSVNFQIRYCPICGRKLKPQSELVKEFNEHGGLAGLFEKW